jgi:hypothetical protein
MTVMKTICHPDCVVRKIYMLSIITGEAVQSVEDGTKEEIKGDKLHIKVQRTGILHQLKAVPEPEILRINKGLRGLATKLDSNSTMINGLWSGNLHRQWPFPLQGLQVQRLEEVRVQAVASPVNINTTNSLAGIQPHLEVTTILGEVIVLTETCPAQVLHILKIGLVEASIKVVTVVEVKVVVVKAPTIKIIVPGAEAVAGVDLITTVIVETHPIGDLISKITVIAVEPI